MLRKDHKGQRVEEIPESRDLPTEPLPAASTLDGPPMSEEPTPVMDAGSPSPADELARGTVVGRYMVLDLLGSGGMGRVYTAYDPDLDRKVALKLLRPAVGDRHRLESRLLREAQALARLNHPQVVAVFDVGTIADAGGERIFVAMELVEGLDLHGWLQAAPRATDHILDIFLEAGRGLAAAHDAGLVHRDFKPGNVLVGDDGRARICDFGLAAGSRDESRCLGIDDLETTAPECLEAPAAFDPKGVTRTGAVLGTPSFMSPEQRRGEAVGPATDQYAFCVALFRALYGQWPESHPRAGEPTDLEREPDRTAMRLQPAILRGLEPRPENRYPSMHELLEELEGLRRDRRSRRLWATAGLSLFGMLLLAVAYPSSTACSGGAQRMTGIWDTDRKAELRSAFAATGSAFSEDAVRAVTATLDDYRDRWVTMHGESCRATRQGEQSEELLDLRMACLDERRHELGSLVKVLTGNAPDVLRGAAEAAASLPSVERCADTAALLAPLPAPDPATEEAVTVARARLARARALAVAGSFDLALDSARQVVDAADPLGYWPLTAEAHFEVARAQERREEVDSAIESLRQALLAAEAGRHDRVAVESFLRLVRLVGYQKMDLEGGEEYARMARALLQGLGQRQRLEALLEDHLGLLSYRRGDYEDSSRHHRRALEMFEPDSPVQDLFHATTLIRLGNAERAAGRLAEAVRHTEQAVALLTRIHGPSHPDVAIALERLGGLASSRGDHHRAVELRRQAVEIVRRSLGDDHPTLAHILLNLGSVWLELRKPTEARAVFEEAARIYDSMGEAGASNRAVVEGNLGSVALLEGRGPAALVHFEKALSLEIELRGPDHPMTGKAHYNLGEIHNRLGEFARALGHHRLALDIWRDRLGERHFLVAHGLTGEGRALLGLGRADDAVPALRRATELWRESGRPEVYSAETDFLMARALWLQGRRALAVELARVARDIFAGSSAHDSELGEVDSWLAEHLDSDPRADKTSIPPPR